MTAIFDKAKFRSIIEKNGYSPNNKGLNGYARNPNSVNNLQQLIEMFPEYKSISRELAILLDDGQRNGNSDSSTVVYALLNVKRAFEKLPVKNLNNVPLERSLYKRIFKFQKLSVGESLKVIKSRLSVVSPKTIEKYRKVMTEIDAAR